MSRQKPLPPYGHDYLADPPGAGLWVCVGPRAWQAAAGKRFPALVLPPGTTPAEFRWPSSQGPALIFETGAQDDDLLLELATTLMIAGAPSVVAIRESLLKAPESCIYFESVAYGE